MDESHEKRWRAACVPIRSRARCGGASGETTRVGAGAGLSAHVVERRDDEDGVGVAAEEAELDLPGVRERGRASEHTYEHEQAGTGAVFARE